MKLSEHDIRRITFETISQLGSNATPDAVKEEVRKKVEVLANGDFKQNSSDHSSGKVILTAFGLNHPGIIAAVTKSLGESNCDIQDVTQKILGDFFTMIMILDISTSPKDLREVQEDMRKTAEQLNIKIYLQHEDVFRFMHRV